MDNKWKLLYRIPGAVVLSYLIGYALSLLASIFVNVSYVSIADIISNVFNFSGGDVVRGVAMNLILPGLGSLSTILSNPDFAARLSLVLLVIGTFIAVAILLWLHSLVLKLANENKLIATLCTLAYAYWFAVAIYANFFLPSSITFWYCVDAVVVLFVYLVMTIILSGSLFDKKWFDFD